MADLPRFSAGSLDSEQFYSAPSSRIASRNVSVNTGARKKPDQTEQALNYTLETIHSEPSDPTFPATEGSSKSWWSANRHQHEPKHHHFCVKPVIQRWKKKSPYSRLPSSDLSNDDYPETEDLDYIAVGDKKSSAALPMTTKRLSSTFTRHGLLEPLQRRSSSPLSDVLNDITNIRRGIEGIVSNIRAYLSHRRHDNCSDPSRVFNEGTPSFISPNGTPRQTAGEEQQTEIGNVDSFLVTTDDIAGILDIVIAGIRSLHDENLPDGCLSMILSRDSESKPTPGVRAVVPQTSTLADPATTISSVEPSFSLQGIEYPSGHRNTSTRTIRSTIISRQSVTEVNWESSADITTYNSPADRGTPRALKAVSPNVSDCSTAHIASTPRSSSLTRPASAGFFRPIGDANPFKVQPERRPSSQPLMEPLANKKSQPIKTTISVPNEQHIVSFPALKSRACTNDWIDPPYQSEDSVATARKRGWSSNLYLSGVDAHSGGPANELSIDDLVVMASAILPKDDLSDSPWSCEQPRPTDNPEMKRMGAAIGTSSHRRKSNVTQHSSQQDDPDSDGALINKLRRYSFMPLVEETPENIRSHTPPQPARDVIPLLGEPTRSSKGKSIPKERKCSIEEATPSGAGERSGKETTVPRQRKRSSRELLQDILAKSLRPGATQVSRDASIKETSKSLKRSGRPECMSCSEDYYPHVCTDELLTPTPLSERTVESLYAESGSYLEVNTGRN